MNLEKLAEEGHFTKVYNPKRTIPPEQFDLLVKFLYSLPQSVNAQCTHWVIASTRETRARIAGAIGTTYAFNAPKIADASHVIVFATRETLTNEYLEEIHQKEVADGKFPNEEIANQWKSIVRGWIDYRRFDLKDLVHWMEKQTYLGLGMMLMAAAELGISAAPLEGFDPRLVDAELGLREKGFTTSAILTLGYRSDSDFYAKTPKSRLPKERHITVL